MRERLARSLMWQTVVVLVAACAVYLPFLGSRPLDASEGHRVVPGWTMLETGEWWRMRMFELTYIRKPPGMSWAIAASSAVFGQNEWGARLPSALAAILASLIACWYGSRWLGRPWGWVAGVTQALLPVAWAAGRSAEIEMLLLLGTQLMALGLVDVLRPVMPHETDEGRVRDVRWRWVSTGVAAAGMVIAALAKGPAGAPVLAGVIVGACVVHRSARPLVSLRLWLAIALASGVLAAAAWKFLSVNGDPMAVREDVAAQFFWDLSRVGGAALLLPLAFVSALPMSLGVLAGVGVHVRRAAADEEAQDRALVKMLAWAWLASVLVLVLMGVSNHRYALPATVLLAPLAAVIVKGAQRGAAAEKEGSAGIPVSRTVLAIMLGALFAGGVATAMLQMRPTRDQLAGPAAAVTLAQGIAAGEGAQPVEIWADDAIEARPDIVWTMAAEAERRGVALRPLWKKHDMLAGGLPPVGGCLLLRTDGASGERDRWKKHIDDGSLVLSSTATVRSYAFTLFRRVR